MTLATVLSVATAIGTVVNNVGIAKCLQSTGACINEMRADLNATNDDILDVRGELNDMREYIKTLQDDVRDLKCGRAVKSDVFKSFHSEMEAE